ncbi:hypothetical protein N7486_002107 [Penicillium sp. IBT 16267x]|nr:hypothetical protein N7486_002107 [Penicillium sp. IBT 16267x]
MVNPSGPESTTLDGLGGAGIFGLEAISIGLGISSPEALEVVIETVGTAVSNMIKLIETATAG